MFVNVIYFILKREYCPKFHYQVVFVFKYWHLSSKIPDSVELFFSFSETAYFKMKFCCYQCQCDQNLKNSCVYKHFHMRSLCS